MDKDLYQIMQKIREKEEENAEKYKKFKVEDVIYKGTIKTIEEVNGVDTEVEKDIFEVIETMLSDGSIVKNYYDENIHYIAGCDKNGQMYPSKNPIVKDININNKIEELGNTSTLSLNEIDKTLEVIAQELGIKKEEVLLSQIDLEQKIGEKQKEEDRIILKSEEEKEDEEKDEKSEKDEKEKNQKALEKVNTKQEIDLDQKVDHRHTLGDVLGIESGAKLLAVYSNAIKDNENTTRYSFIIKKADGTLEKADMLNQIGGKDSNRKVYEINYDGSEVTKKSVNSSYEINSPVVENAVLTAAIGSAGRIEINYAKEGRTERINTIGIKCQDEHTKANRYEVRNELNDENKGENNIEDDKKEIQEHEEYNCKESSIEDIDGDKRTSSHMHTENATERIKEYDADIEEVFTDREIQARLEVKRKQNPEASLDEIIDKTAEDLKIDAENQIEHENSRSK